MKSALSTLCASALFALILTPLFLLAVPFYILFSVALYGSWVVFGIALFLAWCLRPLTSRIRVRTGEAHTIVPAGLQVRSE